MKKYTVSYFDRHPIDPQERHTIKRETVIASCPEEAEKIMIDSDKIIIDVQEVIGEVTRFEGAPHPVEEAQEIERAIDAELSLNPRTQMLIDAGCLNADGSLKPYIATGHKSVPLTQEDVTDFFGN